MSKQPTAYLVDSSIYVFRAWFALPDDLLDIEGHSVNAVYGFSDFLYKLIESERPEHLACVFDESLITSVRNDIYPEYKANRESAPAELKYQFQLCRLLVKSLGVKEFASNQYEADDIIGSLAKNLKKHRFKNVIVTADKDLAQLIEADDYLWDFAKDVWMNPKAIEKKFGVKPTQIADQLALMGDKVDNIPGVPGVGLKTAARLLAKWHDLANLKINLDKVGTMKFRGAKRIQELLAEYWPQIELARQLTGILYDETSPKTKTAVHRRKPDWEALEEMFAHLGFGERRRQQWFALLSD